VLRGVPGRGRVVLDGELCEVRVLDEEGDGHDGVGAHVDGLPVEVLRRRLRGGGARKLHQRLQARVSPGLFCLR
jgi:hypothetical protein